MEENRRFSWTDLFIKVILVVIFVLFTVWLLSLGNKDMSNSLDVLTNNIFSENMEKMKNVGKEYFTIERLPEKVGDVKTLTLEKMYEKNLILKLTDKHGNACSAKNSYVSIEKYENEYQMKVFLECGEESDHVIAIMGCYDYCDSDICEFDKEKTLEYQYKKTTGGKWTNWGKWSDWSKVSVTKNNYRDVETKVGTEEYSYDKTVTNTLYNELVATCPNGYEKQGNTCVKENVTNKYANPVCPTLSSEWSAPTRNGFTCSYTKNTTATANPNKCANKYGDYTLTSQNGFTCNYSKQVTTSYQAPIVKDKICYSQKVVMSCAGCAPVIQNIPYVCGTTTSYETQYTTKTETTTTTATCPTGYTKNGNTCTKTTIETKNNDATCPSGYTKTNDSKCSKSVTTLQKAEMTYSCPVGYNKTSDNTKCYKNVSTTTTVTDTREVTYYRYRVREYIGGTTDYKWSKSKEDKKLLDAGYKLTGKTR